MHAPIINKNKSCAPKIYAEVDSPKLLTDDRDNQEVENEKIYNKLGIK